jgi:DNA-binding GntR family transcriptional regulator
MSVSWSEPADAGGGVEVRPSKAELVYTTLRNDIVRLAIVPGTAIEKQAVCDRLSVSRFPVSDALSRLGREGLVTIEPQRGSFAALLDADVIEAALFIRAAIETEACRIIASRISLSDTAALAASVARQFEYETAGDMEAAHAEDVVFHQLIVSLVRLPGVQAHDDAAAAHLERLRRLSATGTGADTVAQHVQILEALRRGDGDAAAEAMRAHLHQSRAALIALRELRPELFSPTSNGAIG